MGDIFPEESERWRAIEANARRRAGRYGYGEIRTPMVEPTELFVRSIGATTDIVEKEMFTFSDSAGKSLSLRPEGTAGAVRAYIQSNVGTHRPLAKYYYLGPMFRREKPQAGRRRQFHQFGTEALGSSNPALDAETIDLMIGFVSRLGLTNCRLAINSVGCLNCRPQYIETLKDYLQKNRSALCDNCKKRIQRNTLRVLDCKNPACRKVISGAPRITESLCSDCRNHFRLVREYLETISIEYTLEPLLVRGLDYYTGTVFELYSSGLGAQDALGAGGRYDNLVEELGGEPTRAVGFSIGMERLMMLLEGREIPEEKEGGASVFFAGLGEEAFRMNFELLARLRGEGVTGEMDYLGRSLKAQMREANREGVDFVIIRGEDEIEKGGVQLKDMESGEEGFVKEEALIKKIRNPNV